MSSKDKIVVGITMGDMAGVGPEIIIKTFMDERIYNHCTPVLFGNPKVIGTYRKLLDVERMRYSTIRSFSHLGHNTLNMSLAWEEEVEFQPGQPTAETGKYALKSLHAAIQALQDGEIDVLVTSPINKSVMKGDDFQHPGHTEYLQETFGASNSLMFMVSEHLKVGVVTGHIPVSEVAANLSQEAVSKALKTMHTSLKEDFGIDKPKIAVLGLNPHAGESGHMGSEDAEVISPVIAEARKKGMLVSGPYAADGFFGACKHLAFDGILAMYHDQGLIPFKYIAGDKGVNYSAGLPIVRTSPDHGTAEDIAGKGKASPESFRSAIFMALDIHRHRNGFEQRHANPLQPQSDKRSR